MNTPHKDNDAGTSDEKLRLIKQQFFALRNGVIADILRRSGSPFKVVFGLNLPQLTDIAAQFGPDPDLGRLLWRNTTTRESMLLAPMLMDVSSFSIDEAREWLSAAPATEVIDILCHRLLRHVAYAADLAESLSDASDTMSRYSSVRLMFNLVTRFPAQAHALAGKVAAIPCPLTDYIAKSLMEEASLLQSGSS